MSTPLSTCPRCGSPLPPGIPADACPGCLIRLGAAPSLGEPTKTSWGGAFPPAPDPSEIALDFPQLEILELLGRGGMGAVYKARQKSLDRIVALKILAVPGDAGPTFTERFVREARTLAGLSHPSIVTVHDFGKAGERYYLLMEYVDGTDLHRLIRGGAIRPRQALEMVSRICEALQFAHDAGVVHRDIKPENILVDRHGRVKIADFGLARILRRDAPGPALTGDGQVMGTAHYMAPEQLEHPLEVDHRADIYSLGVVFYELLTGELPLGKFEPPSRRIEVDVRVDEVVLRALEKEPARRYQQASQVKTDVDGISSTLGAGAAPRRAWPRWVWLPVGAAAIAFAVWIAGSVKDRPQPSPEPEPEAKAVEHVEQRTAPALVVAAARGQREIVTSLLAAGADVNERGPGETTPLIEAIDRKDPELIALLVSKGADVNARRQDGTTPLILAAARGDRETAELLLRTGADVNAKGPSETTPLIEAIDRKDPELIALLVSKGADVNARRQDGTTPLILAAARGDRETAELLLRTGADVNAKGPSETTPLIEAIDRKDPELTALLVSKGADVNARRQDGTTPLILAAARGDRETAERLLRTGADVNAKGPSETTPLIEAIDRKDPELTALLVSKGADVNARREGGTTPLILAAARGDRETAELLLRAGADVNAKGPSETTPLIEAIDRKDPELTALLVSKGADVNARRQDGVTPLILAAARGDRDMVEALVRGGADVNSRTSGGRSALEEAVDRGDADIVKTLLAAGAKQGKP